MRLRVFFFGAAKMGGLLDSSAPAFCQDLC